MAPAMSESAATETTAPAPNRSLRRINTRGGRYGCWLNRILAGTLASGERGALFRPLTAGIADSVDADLREVDAIAHDRRLPGGHLVHLQHVGEEDAVLIVVETGRIVLGHVGVHEVVEIRQRPPCPFLSELGPGMRDGGVTTRAEAHVQGASLLRLVGRVN